MGESSYLRRYVDDFLDFAMPELPAFMVTGPRGCGKSTTAGQRAKTVLPLDLPGQAELMRAQPDELLARSEPPVVIDEWQEVPESLGAVKRSVDTGSGPGQYIITGSVRSRLMETSTWPGTGRLTPLKMQPLARGEIEGSATAIRFLDRLFCQQVESGRLSDAPSLFDYLDMVTMGGFPEGMRLSEELRPYWFEGYVEQLIGRDVADLAVIRAPETMRRLLESAALNTAGLPNKNVFARSVGANYQTVSKYLDLLVELGIIEMLPAWSSNKLKRLVKVPKLHVTDTGLAIWLSGTGAKGLLEDGGLRGRMIESFVVAQLRPLLQVSRTRARAFHLRDDNGRWEIDVIFESRGGDLVAAEVKAGQHPAPRDARHLAQLRDATGEKFQAGVVLHTGAESYSLGDRLWALPIAKIWR